jgi:hypothetical protein
MRVLYDFGTARVIDADVNGLRVEVKVGDEWQPRGRFDVRSDDYAYTNAREYAEHLSKQ